MPLTSAEKMRAMRAKAKGLKRCIVCVKRKPKLGLVVCRDCNDSAKERVKKSRA